MVTAVGGTPRVVMVVRLFSPWVGGTERQALKLASRLRREGVDTSISTGWWFRGTPRRETVEGVPVFRNSTLWEFFGVKGLRKLGGYLYIVTLVWHLWRTRGSYDLIHVHGLNYHTCAAVWAGRLAGTPVIVKLANSGTASDILRMEEGRQLALSRLMLRTALRCDRFVALNPAIVEELLSRGIDRGRIVTLPNGVDVPAHAKDSYSLGEPALVVYVGRLHPQKGLDTLLGALAAVRRSHPGRLHLRLVGDGPERSRLEALARSLGIEEMVEFSGSRDDVDRMLLEADAFVLPSSVEGLSNALLEAMALGVPVVASRIPGNAAVISDGESGLLFEPGDEASLADALRRVLSDRDLRERMGRRGRRLIRERFDMEVVGRQYLALYREVLEIRTPVPELEETAT